MVLHPPQSLVPPPGGTTSLGPNGLSSGRTWCLTLRKALFLRSEAPRLSAGPSLRRPGRGASPSANPYSFVRKHHAYRPVRASGDPDVVLHCPQILIPSSGSTTPNGSVRRRLCWRRPPRKTLTLRRATPTWPGFSRSAGAFVGVTLPANLNPSSGHANLARPSLRQPGLPFSYKEENATNIYNITRY